MKNLLRRKAIDFTEVVFNCLREYHEKRMSEIMDIATSCPAPQFYTGVETARRFVSLIERGKPLPLKNKLKIEMYEEIHRRFIEYRKKRYEEGALTVNYCCLLDIIKQPAPSFYTDSGTLRSLFYKYLRCRHENR